MVEMSIGELAERVSIRTSTLRYYEDIGLLSPTKRISGRRFYDESVLQRLAIIQTGKEAGFTLAELKTLLDKILDSGVVIHGWRELVERKLAEMEMRLREIRTMKRLLEDITDCDDDNLAECIVLTGQHYQQK